MGDNKGHDNLKPIKTTERAKELGAKGGKAKKGSKHISTHIREMLDDPEFELKLKDGTILKGRPMEAILKTAVAKAVSGDMRAFDMLGKYGYGTKLTHDFEKGLLSESVLQIRVVDDRDNPESATEESS